jgi:hypothetical protein
MGLCLARLHHPQFGAVRISVSPFLSSILAFSLLLAGQDGSVDTPPEPSGDQSTMSTGSKFSCRDKSYAKDLPASGPACETELFARRGRPFMFPARYGIAFGVSSGPDKPSALYLWADNQTDKARSLPFCCVSTLFEHIDIFDSEGHRVLSKTDRSEQKAQLAGREVVQACTCSGSSSVPPHTIQLFLFADISDGYTLQSGRYTISERNPPAPYSLRPDKQETASHAPSGLGFSLP